MLKIPVSYLSIHIHLLIPRNFIVQDQVLLCCESSSTSIKKEVVLRPMANVGPHISKLIIIIIIIIIIIKVLNNNNSYKNLEIINIIKLVLSIIEQTQINFFLKRNLNIKRC